MVIGSIIEELKNLNSQAVSLQTEIESLLLLIEEEYTLEN